jgi:hypothetical protein
MPLHPWNIWTAAGSCSSVAGKQRGRKGSQAERAADGKTDWKTVPPTRFELVTHEFQNQVQRLT